MSHLTTVARVKAYLGGNLPTTTDALLEDLIGHVSAQIVAYTSRNFGHYDVQDVRLHGTGTTRLMLPANPIAEVSALSIGGKSYSLVTEPETLGYMFDSKFLYGCGGLTFPLGFLNIKASFVAGYLTTEEGAIPGSGARTITPVTGKSEDVNGRPAATSGPANHDIGVTDANGVAMTRISTGNIATGQYKFNEAQGAYTFSSDDSNQVVTMEYVYVPGAVEQAAWEMIGAIFERRKNLGVSSRSLAGETITYDPKLLTAAVKELLQPYRYVIAP